MKTKTLLEKLKDYLSAERREQLARYDSMKRILKKLKKKENALKEKLADEKDENVRRKIERKLDIVKAQRKKGVSTLKELKQQQ